MALPSNVNTGHVHGRYFDLSGKPVVGSVAFAPKASRLVDASELAVIVPRVLTARLIDGVIDIDLPATDDTDLSPNGFTYEVTEKFRGGSPPYNIEVPAGTVVELSSVLGVSASRGTITSVGGGGAVDSVDGQTGTVVLSGSYDAAGAASSAVSAHVAATDPHGDRAYTDDQIADLVVGGGGVSSGQLADAVSAEAALRTAADDALGDQVAGLTYSDVGADPAGAASAAQTAAASYTDTVAAGKADLVGGKLVTSQVPLLAITDTFPTDDEAGMLALTAQRGDVAIRPDGNWILRGDDPSDLDSWSELAAPTGAVISVNGQTGAIVLGYADVGAASTSDARLSDARTPTAHAASHGSAGSDAVTVAQSQVTGLATALSAKQDASGLGTAAFVNTGTSSGNVPTIAQADGRYSTIADAKAEVIMVALGDETTAITTGTAKVTFRMPFAMTLSSVRASLTTASSSGLPTVNIKESGTTIFSTKLTIDASEKTSTTAATAAVISDANLADDAEMTIDIDVAGTGAAGLKVYLIGTRA